MDSRPKLRFVRESCALILLCLIAVSASFGQEAQHAGASNIEILKLGWKKQLRLPRNFDPAIIPAAGGFTDPAKAASSASAAPATQPAFESSPYVTFPSTPGRLAVVFVYSMKVRNAGEKTIEGVAWDFISVDASNNELGKHTFLSYGKIRSEESRYFQEQLRSPPVRVISTSGSSKYVRPKFVERAIIDCVLYADGSSWQNPRARDGICESLKNGKALARRRREAN